MSVSVSTTNSRPTSLSASKRGQVAAASPNRPSGESQSSPDTSSVAHSSSSNEVQWGSNFWVTLIEPQTNTAFYACPSTGQVSWDPPAGHFVLPPSADGEWWELSDESRGGIPYYYHTKTGETVWERPQAFVIPLSILQNTAVGRRMSLNMFGGEGSTAMLASTNRRVSADVSVPPQHRRSSSNQSQRSASSHGSGSGKNPSRVAQPRPSPAMRRAATTDPHVRGGSPAAWSHGQSLSPIPGSPNATDADTDADRAPPRSAPADVTTMPRELAAERASRRTSLNAPKEKGKERAEKSRERASRMPDEMGRMAGSGAMTGSGTTNGVSTTSGTGGTSSSTYITASTGRGRSKSQSRMSSLPAKGQSLNAAASLVVQGAATPLSSPSARKSMTAVRQPAPAPVYTSTPVQQRTRSGTIGEKDDGAKAKEKKAVPPSPNRPSPAVPGNLGGSWAKRNGSAFNISKPVLDLEATMTMSAQTMGKPLHVDHEPTSLSAAANAHSSKPILPNDLVSDIQQFIESEFARQYFSTHRTGFLFKRRVPVEQMMTWQKAPLTSPLLMLNRGLHKDAVRVFKVIQRIMGERSGPLRSPGPTPGRTATFTEDSNRTSGGMSAALLEEQRWLLGEGLAHGELRDEIFCQLMKQLMGNPSAESIFKGWQFLCVLLITFPPSKNFEAYLRSFIHQRTNHSEGRVDIMAKYCLRRLVHISKKGPRGKVPAPGEIETASDAAFNPSIFGESLDSIIRLQARQYPDAKIPIILPFLADGILALGGAKAEGIFRIPGDGDDVAALKTKIERGYYSLDGVEDAHALASLLKLWLRELLDPLVPDEMYNDCIASARQPEACVALVSRLPTINRRVVLFVISFLQLFLDPKIQKATKMTPVNLALVMAPNLLRCNSESMAVVFTNSQYEQHFVYNLLLHLHCDEADADYRPSHGLGAKPRASMSSTRRR